MAFIPLKAAEIGLFGFLKCIAYIYPIFTLSFKHPVKKKQEDKQMFAAVIIAVWIGGNLIADKCIEARRKKKARVYRVRTYKRDERESA